MKHWDRTTEEVVAPHRLSRRERQRLRAMFAEQPQRRRKPPHVGSVIGLALALAVMAGLAWALAPVDPVSAKLL